MLSASDTSQTRRNAPAVVIVIVALVIQVTVVDRLPLPGSVTPDLVLLTVVALAMTNGPLSGLVIGFAVGLATDIVPPADHTIGRYALVYCLVGYVCGQVGGELERSPLFPFIAVAAGALAGSVLYAGVGMLLGDPHAGWSEASRVLPLAVLYDVLVSPFVVWVVLRLTRRAVRHDRLDALPGVYRAR